MTVRELIEKLQEMPPDDEVYHGNEDGGVGYEVTGVAHVSVYQQHCVVVE